MESIVEFFGELKLNCNNLHLLSYSVNFKYLCFLLFSRERPERPERCHRGPPPAIRAKIEEAAASIPEGGLCDADSLHAWFEETKKDIKDAVREEKKSLIEDIMGEV